MKIEMKYVFRAMWITGLVMLTIARVQLHQTWHWAHKPYPNTPPEGWSIVVDQSNQFAPRYSNGYVINEVFATQQKAVDRAWQQVEYEQELASHQWKEVVSNDHGVFVSNTIVRTKP